MKRQTFSSTLYLPANSNSQSFLASDSDKQTITITNPGISNTRGKIYPGSIKDLSKVARVVSVTNYRNGQPRNLTQSRTILTEARADSEIVRVPDVGTLFVGESESEEELKETFLTTGIFQRKEGDSLDGRRSFKGQRFKRQASRRFGRSQLNSNQNSYAQRRSQKRSLVRRLSCDYLGRMRLDFADAPYEAPVSPQP